MSYERGYIHGSWPHGECARHSTVRGALSVKKATKGLFITTAQFSESARRCAEDQAVASIALVDGKELANLMIEYGVGVSTRSVFEVKSIDSDFFDEL